MAFDVAAALRVHAAELECYFNRLFAVPGHATGHVTDVAPPRLIEAIRYSLHAGGKRLRPALVLEAFDAVAIAAFDSPASLALEASQKDDRDRPQHGGLPQPFTQRDAALTAAAAMELIHTFSLVHDDLPAMDDDDLRRGRPTNHKVFGEAVAILAGDAMMTLAFELLAAVPDAALAARLIGELARAAGPGGMIGGQILDMAAEGVESSRAQLEQIHRMKTAALLAASLRMGAIAGGAAAPVVDCLGTFGRELGLAFQITDDLLDETATPEQLGKATKKDAGRGKTTYPRLLGLDGSRAAAAKHTRAAIEALRPLGDRGQQLKALADFVLTRSM